MKRLTIVCALLISSPASAEEVHELRDASAKSQVKIINISGEIEVEGWSRNEIEIEADLGSEVKEFIFEIDGDDVLIEVKVPNHNSRSVTSDLVIKVPQDSSLNVSSVSSDVTVEGVRGRLRLTTVSGDIETTTYASDVDIEAVSGDIDVQGDDEKMRIRAATVSGDAELNSLNGELEINTVTGDIGIFSSRFENAELHTVNGDIEFNAGLHGETRMDVETVNGDVDIHFDDKVSARFDIETFNGDIDNCFGPESERTSKYAPGRELKFTEGGGDGRVIIRTLNGDLTLCYE